MTFTQANRVRADLYRLLYLKTVFSSLGSFMKFIVVFARRKIYLRWTRQNFSVCANLLKQGVYWKYKDAKKQGCQE